jgi:hypothetical protein
VNGEPLPSEVNGWHKELKADPTLYCAAVKVIRLDDGQTLRFYLMLMKPSAQKELKKAAKKKLKRVRRENKQAEQREAKQAKRATRALLAMLGR